MSGRSAGSSALLWALGLGVGGLVAFEGVQRWHALQVHPATPPATSTTPKPGTPTPSPILYAGGSPTFSEKPVQGIVIGEPVRLPAIIPERVYTTMPVSPPVYLSDLNGPTALGTANSASRDPNTGAITYGTPAGSAPLTVAGTVGTAPADTGAISAALASFLADQRAVKNFRYIEPPALTFNVTQAPGFS